MVVSTYAYERQRATGSSITTFRAARSMAPTTTKIAWCSTAPHTAYTYTANGDLAARTISTQTTRYTYDALGNLTTVALPDGRSLTYLVDGRNRRIGKLVNGVLAKGCLYQDGLKPIAEVDGRQHCDFALCVRVPNQRARVHMIKGGVIYRIVVADHLGSPRLVVDVASGSVSSNVSTTMDSAAC